MNRNSKKSRQLMTCFLTPQSAPNMTVVRSMLREMTAASVAGVLNQPAVVPKGGNILIAVPVQTVAVVIHSAASPKIFSPIYSAVKNVVVLLGLVERKKPKRVAETSPIR